MNATLAPDGGDFNARMKLHAELLGSSASRLNAGSRVMISKRNARHAESGRISHQIRGRELPVACLRVHVQIDCHNTSSLCLF